MNKDKLIAKCEVVANMSDNEGVKALADVIMELLETLDKKEIGFKKDTK